MVAAFFAIFLRISRSWAKFSQKRDIRFFGETRSRSRNVYVSKLLQFLKEGPAIEILNIHGEGYRLMVRG